MLAFRAAQLALGSEAHRLIIHASSRRPRDRSIRNHAARALPARRAVLGGRARFRRRRRRLRQRPARAGRRGRGGAAAPPGGLSALEHRARTTRGRIIADESAAPFDSERIGRLATATAAQATTRATRTRPRPSRTTSRASGTGRGSRLSPRRASTRTRGRSRTFRAGTKNSISTFEVRGVERACS